MATIEITCDNSAMIYNQTYLVEYANHPMNITRNISLEHYQCCNLSIVFSNSAGHSEPFTFPDIFENNKSPSLDLLFLLTLVLVPIIFIIIILVSCLLLCKFTNRCCFARKGEMSIHEAKRTDQVRAIQLDGNMESTHIQENQHNQTLQKPNSKESDAEETQENNNPATEELGYGVPAVAATLTSGSLTNITYEIPQSQPQYTDKITSTTYTESDTTSAGMDPVIKPLLRQHKSK
jgi:hypothetical protein